MALNSGYHLAYVIGAALVMLAILVAVVVLRADEPAEAQAEPERIDTEPIYSQAA